MDVHRVNTKVRLVGFHPLQTFSNNATSKGVSTDRQKNKKFQKLHECVFSFALFQDPFDDRRQPPVNITLFSSFLTLRQISWGVSP